MPTSFDKGQAVSRIKVFKGAGEHRGRGLRPEFLILAAWAWRPTASGPPRRSPAMIAPVSRGAAVATLSVFIDDQRSATIPPKRWKTLPLPASSAAPGIPSSSGSSDILVHLNGHLMPAAESLRAGHGPRLPVRRRGL